MTNEHSPNAVRTNTLTVMEAAELAQIAFALDLSMQAQFFVEIAFMLADGEVVEEDAQQAIDLLREAASSKEDFLLNAYQKTLIGAASKKITVTSRRAHAALSSSGECSPWPFRF